MELPRKMKVLSMLARAKNTYVKRVHVRTLYLHHLWACSHHSLGLRLVTNSILQDVDAFVILGFIW